MVHGFYPAHSDEGVILDVVGFGNLLQVVCIFRVKCSGGVVDEHVEIPLFDVESRAKGITE